jgi:hypothetical protein
MATVTFTISGADLTRVVNALSVRFGYSDTLPNGNPNPQTRGEFVRLRIAQWAADETKAHELAQARASLAASDVVVS